MDPVVIGLIIIGTVVVIGLIAWAMTRKSHERNVRKQEQAREHLQEAHVNATRAEREQAVAQEQAARARRERAEAEERVAQAEREAKERMAAAERHRTEAHQHQEKANELAPDLRVEHEDRTAHEVGTRRDTRRGH